MPAIGPPVRPSATTTTSTRSGPPPGSGSRSTTVSCSTSATTMATGREGGPPHPGLPAPQPGAPSARRVPSAASQSRRISAARRHAGRARQDGVGCGVTVTVTVGVGFGPAGSTENLGLCRGGATTMPTTPSAAKSTKGRTIARAVSEPTPLLHLADHAHRHAGHVRPVMHRRRGDQLLARPQRGAAAEHLQPEQAGRDRPLPVPVTQPICPALASWTPTTEVVSEASSTVACPGADGGHRADQPGAVEYRLLRP